MIHLRPYQLDDIQSIRDALGSHRLVLYTLPTGGGKTALSTAIAKATVENGHHVWFIVHRRELLKQTVAEFRKWDIEPGVIASGWSVNPYRAVQVCSIQTLTRRVDKLRKPRLIIVDEAHHSRAASWAHVIDACPDAIVIGLTATPCRLDGKGLDTHYEHLVSGPSMKWLITNGYLSPYKAYAPATVDLGKVRTVAGDYNSADLAELMDRNVIIGDAVGHYKRLSAGKRALVFCVSVAHSKHVCRAFCDAGIPAAHVDGTTPMEKRDAIFSALRSGRIMVLCNVEICGEGIDIPAIETVMMLRPTKSLVLMLQQCGRGLRVIEGKTHAVLLDHVGNFMRLGLPDEDRVWSLTGIEKKVAETKNEIAVRQCPKCYRVVFLSQKICECGYEWEVNGREVDTVDGELVEVKGQVVLRRKMQGQAGTLEELVKLGRARGMNNPHGWAKHVIKGRKRRVKV